MLMRVSFVVTYCTKLFCTADRQRHFNVSETWRKKWWWYSLFCFRQENILFGKFGPIMIKKFGNCQFKGELHSNYVFLFFHLKWPRIRFYNPFYKNELFFSSKTHIFTSFAQDTYGDPRGPRTFKDSRT